MNNKEELEEELAEEIGDYSEGSSTNSCMDAYQCFMSYVNNTEQLSSATNLELIKEYHSADEQDKLSIKNRIIEGNLRLVIKVVKQVLSKWYDNHNNSSNLRTLTLDCIQEGSIALGKAIDDFDIDKGNAFSTVAVTYVRNSIFTFLNNNINIIRIPPHVKDKYRKIKEARENLQQKLGRNPTDGEICEFLNDGTTIDDISQNALLMNASKISDFDSPLDSNNESDSQTLSEITPSNELTPAEVYGAKEFEEQSLKALGELNDTEKKVLIMRYGLDGKEKMTLEAIGKVINLSTERVRQIEVEAKRKLKKIMSL